MFAYHDRYQLGFSQQIPVAVCLVGDSGMMCDWKPPVPAGVRAAHEVTARVVADIIEHPLSLVFSAQDDIVKTLSEEMSIRESTGSLPQFAAEALQFGYDMPEMNFRGSAHEDAHVEMIRHDASALNPYEWIKLFQLFHGLGYDLSGGGWYGDRRPVMISGDSLYRTEIGYTVFLHQYDMIYTSGSVVMKRMPHACAAVFAEMGHIKGS